MDKKCWMCCDYSPTLDSTIMTLFSVHVMDERHFHGRCYLKYCYDITNRSKRKNALDLINKYVDEKETNYLKAVGGNEKDNIPE